MIENKSLVSRIRVVIIYFVILLLTVLCVFPVWNMVCMSFSSAVAVSANWVKLWPVDFTLEAYIKIVEDSQFWRSFGISVLRVVIALIIQLVFVALMAYPLSQSEQYFYKRNLCMKFFLITMLFNGGMVPTYMLIKELEMLDTIWSLVLPTAIQTGNVILVLNFFRRIPASLEEAAIVDGANPFQVLLKVFLPISKPIMATMALYVIVQHWNDFMTGKLYIMKFRNYPLMSYIQSIQINLAEAAKAGITGDDLAALQKVSGKNLNAAKVVVTMLPLLMVYPFLQKYLIIGITMGSVKE